MGRQQEERTMRKSLVIMTAVAALTLPSVTANAQTMQQDRQNQLQQQQLNSKQMHVLYRQSEKIHNDTSTHD
jgi:type II secretory pathway pseudopilin PulG